MNIVKEHINFERGLNPKDSMQIGDIEWRRTQKIKDAILQIMQDIMQMYNGQNLEIINNLEKSPSHESKKHHYKVSFYYNSFKVFIEVFFNDFAVTEEWNIDSLFSGYEDKKAKTGIHGHREYQVNLEEAKKHLIKEINDKLNIKESYNFERGLNPKRAMRIGKEYWKIGRAHV
jgi:hypothetical protein